VPKFLEKIMDEKVDLNSPEELMKRCNIYAFLAGKQIGAILSLSDMVNSNLLTVSDIKESLMDIVKESMDDVDKYLFGHLSQS
jgi:hypothetical protein